MAADCQHRLNRTTLCNHGFSLDHNVQKQNLLTIRVWNEFGFGSWWHILHDIFVMHLRFVYTLLQIIFMQLGSSQISIKRTGTVSGIHIFSRLRFDMQNLISKISLSTIIWLPGNSFHVTAPLWGESTGWYHSQRACNAELWCFLYSLPEQAAE